MNMRLNLGGLDKRKMARVLAVVAVALATGHLVQTMAARKMQPPPQTAQPGNTAKPKAVVQLAATNDAAALPPAMKTPLYAATSSLPVALSVGPAFPVAVSPTPKAPTVVADPCPVTLDLMADPGAMIGMMLLAPCHPGERVVVRHAGLAVTMMTTATGLVFLALPALETNANVQVRFTDGSDVSGTVTVSDLATVRRFGVQWQGDDAFQVYGIEPANTISATDPGVAPVVDLPLSGGFLTRLGDASAVTPLLAEIYTYPDASRAEVVVEAAVTPGTCGREILGETLVSVAGSVTVTDLSLVMPECDAIGDFLVLNNLASDLTLAAAN
jgi:hypothetical protein